MAHLHGTFIIIDSGPLDKQPRLGLMMTSQHEKLAQLYPENYYLNT
jgi:hypothetical protein